MMKVNQKINLKVKLMNFNWTYCMTLTMIENIILDQMKKVVIKILRRKIGERRERDKG